MLFDGAVEPSLADVARGRPMAAVSFDPVAAVAGEAPVLGVTGTEEVRAGALIGAESTSARSLPESSSDCCRCGCDWKAEEVVEDPGV